METVAGVATLATIVSLLDNAIRIGLEIYSMIEADRDKKGTLLEIGNKIQNVNNVLERIRKSQMSVDSIFMNDIVKGLEALQIEVKNVKRLGRFMYLLQRKDCQEKLNGKILTVQFYLQSLNVNQGNTLFEKADEIQRMLTQVASSNNTDLEEQLKAEREQADELRRQVDEKELQLQQLQAMGLGTPDELKLALKEVDDERKRRLEDTEDIMSAKEAEYLEAVIQLLQETEVPEVPTPRTFIVPNCPISLEPLQDPVIVDCACRSTVSRSSFVEWMRHGGPPKCPVCTRTMHSPCVTPNVALRETLEANLGLSAHEEASKECVSSHDTQPQPLHPDEVKEPNADIELLK